MKLYLCTLIFLSLGCHDHKVQSPISIDASTNKTKAKSDIDTTLHATADIITIVGGISDTLKLSKNNFNYIVDNLPNLHSEYTVEPDISYGISEQTASNPDPHQHLPLGCEVCQDEYYILYSYFLKKKNGDRRFAGRRDTLIHIYRNVNEIFDILAVGGTYFGHQFSRIDGYTEYSIYLYAVDSADFKKPYKITKQKKLYITLLKQMITDEVSNDNYNGLTEKDKHEKIKSLLAVIDRMDSLITDYFYLSQAQQFQYAHY